MLNFFVLSCLDEGLDWRVLVVVALWLFHLEAWKLANFFVFFNHLLPWLASRGLSYRRYLIFRLPSLWAAYA